MFKKIQLIDALHIYQDFDFDLPYLSDTRSITYDTQSGEVIRDSQPSFTYEGSHTTSIKINLSGRRVTISRGNPSKVNRLDNLFGYKTIDDCVACYNKILVSLGLPPFTECTHLLQLMGKDGVRVNTVSDGAVVTEVHTTTNKMVGKGNEKQYLKGISTQRLRNSIPHLAPNGCTVQWLSKLGNAALVHSSVYAKANEIELHQLPKIKRLYGEDSEQYKQLLRVHKYCLDNGVVRFENKHKARSLKRQNLHFWGLSNYEILDTLQKEFLDIDNKLSVNAMTHQSISERLKEEGICKSTQAANSTASYYFMWLQGELFDFKKTQVQMHRARLRKLHIDIAESCDLTKHSAIFITSVTEIEVKTLPVPEWYQMPEKISNLRLVA